MVWENKFWIEINIDDFKPELKRSEKLRKIRNENKKNSAIQNTTKIPDKKKERQVQQKERNDSKNNLNSLGRGIGFASRT